MVKVVQAQLAFAFTLGAAAAVAAHFAYKKLHVGTTKSEQFQRDSGAVIGGSDEMQQALLEEQLSRIRTFFGKDGFESIGNAFVIVVGVGGVGSHAAHMLARSGVGRLRLIDFDNVTLSSLNRHAVATRADVGLPKVTAMKRHLLETVPHCQIEAIPMMFEASCADEMLAGNPTFVLDCIDDVTTKLALLESVTLKGLKAITSMGAGGKSDPTRLQIGTLADVVRDPLATKIRYFLRKRDLPGADNITTVYSSEKTVATLLPLDAEQADAPQDFGSVERMRIRVIPVLGTMPALFGQTMAAYVLCSMGKSLFSPQSVAALSKDQRNKLYHSIQNREKKSSSELELDRDELDFIYMEIWRGRSAISGTRQGGRDRLYMARWRPERPLRPDNVVYLTTKELEQLDEHGVDSFPPDVIARVDKRLRSFGAWSM